MTSYNTFFISMFIKVDFCCHAACNLFFNHHHFRKCFLNFDFLNVVCKYFLTSVLLANWQCLKELHVSKFLSLTLLLFAALDLNEASCSKQGINYYVSFSLRLNVTGTSW